MSRKIELSCKYCGHSWMEEIHTKHGKKAECPKCRDTDVVMKDISDKRNIFGYDEESKEEKHDLATILKEMYD